MRGILFVDILVLAFSSPGILSYNITDDSLNSMKSEEHLRQSVTELFGQVPTLIPIAFDISNRSGEHF
jgi:hypothetical protein